MQNNLNCFKISFYYYPVYLKHKQSKKNYIYVHVYRKQKSDNNS